MRVPHNVVETFDSQRLILLKSGFDSSNTAAGEGEFPAPLDLDQQPIVVLTAENKAEQGIERPTVPAVRENQPGAYVGLEKAFNRRRRGSADHLATQVSGTTPSIYT